MEKNFWIYLLIMFAVTYLLRVIPMVAVRKKIKSKFIRSILDYVPCSVLAAMTFPAIFFATDSVFTASAGVVTAVIMSFLGAGIFPVSMGASAAVFIASMLPF